MLLPVLKLVLVIADLGNKPICIHIQNFEAQLVFADYMQQGVLF